MNVAPLKNHYLALNICCALCTQIFQLVQHTVRAEIFAVVLFSRISRVKPSRKFPLQFMSIYSNDNISKIAKLTTRELPHLAKTAKITVRENNGVYSTLALQGIIFLVSHHNLCIFDMTAIQNIFCVAVFFHRSVQNFIWNIYPSADIANQIWGGKLFPALTPNLWNLRLVLNKYLCNCILSS